MTGLGRASRFLARFAILGAAGLSLTLAACGSKPTSKESVERSPDVSREEMADRQQGGLFGKNMNLFSASKGDTPDVAVNAYLWRAALDTVSFLPLASADPFGGTIITDWYSLAETPDERFKVNVFILGRALRADGLKVTVFRQIKDVTGKWADATVGAEVSPEFEDAVLARARHLRLQAVSDKG